MSRFQFVSLALCLSTVAVAADSFVPRWEDKVDPEVFRAAFSSKDWKTEFLIVLQEQADLTSAATLRSKIDKGWFVYNGLRATAQRTQTPLVVQLHKAGVPLRPFWIANMIWAEGDLAVVKEMAERSDVRKISANPWIPMSFPSLDLRRPSEIKAVEWNLTKVRAPEVWALGYNGQGVVIGGQDTGYDWDHPALKNQYRGWDGAKPDHNYNWHDAIHSGGGSCGPNSVAPCDDSQHGTHTMGTMEGDDEAGNQIGMAPGARWIGCRNMNVGWGSPATYTECFEWFLAPTDTNNLNPDPGKAPDVINNSWGCPSSEGCTDPNVLKTVIENTRAAGIVVVGSAGNDGSSCSTVRNPPAIYEAVLSVGNTDSGDAISPSSSRGPVTVDGSGRLKPNVCAPGTSIRSCVPGGGYGNMSGTSMAGPHVAGLVALILSAHPGLRGEVGRVERLMEQTAVRLTTSAQTCGNIAGTNVPNNTYGWGRIDAVEAVGLSDSDHDGVPNWWEVIFDLNRTNSADANLDPDGDGMSNYQEFIANTDPTNGSSILKLTVNAVSPTGSVSISWNSRQDGFDSTRTYNLYRSDRPAGGVWEAVATNLLPLGDTSVWTGNWETSITTCYFRVAARRFTNEASSRSVAIHPPPRVGSNP
jgi:serine protease AprX